MSSPLVVLSRPAEEDLNSIYDYLAAEASPEIADLVVARFFEAMLRTAAYPLSLRERPDYLGYRRINVFNFAIFYLPKPTGQGISIVRILGGRQDIPSHLR
jgi:plasmid stabilization system protein ParE